MGVVDRFSPPGLLKVPILFLTFKRLETTSRVFEMIRSVKPPALYVASDGPRENVSEEAEKVRSVREYILSRIDWDCNVKTLLREKNLGCGRAVSEAISWFFDQEEMGIILEDDTLPSLSFFWFCEELLQRYKNNKKIGMISGCNFQNGIRRGNGDYYFSVYSHIWGWASWHDRWKSYSFSMEDFKDDSFIDKIFSDSRPRKYWKGIFMKMKNHEIDTWDYQWTFTLWRMGQLSIIPNANLVTNIGFGEEGTHLKKGSCSLILDRSELVIETHPTQVVPHDEADMYTFLYHYKPRLSVSIILSKLRNGLQTLWVKK